MVFQHWDALDTQELFPFRGLLHTARSFAYLRIAGPVAVPLLHSPLHVRRKARYRPAWLA
jgi:hypothetical protein